VGTRSGRTGRYVTRPLVVADASIVLKWFHAEGEDAVGAARAILEAFARRQIELAVLDVSIYEIGNTLLTAGAGPQATATVLRALTEICQPTALRDPERATAARLASQYHLTFRDASYAAVTLGRGGRLVTMNRRLITANLGVRPEHAFD
jgi:predicted nucleic acid-binding protein